MLQDLKFVCQDFENKIASLDALIAENSVAADIECGISSISTAAHISDTSSKDNNMIQKDLKASSLDGSNTKKRRVSLEESSIVYSDDLIIIDQNVFMLQFFTSYIIVIVTYFIVNCFDMNLPLVLGLIV